MNFIRLSWNSHLKSKKMYTIVKSRCNLVPEREFTRWMLILVTILLKCVLSASASSIDVSPSSSSPPSMPTTNCSLVAHIFEGRGISTAEIPRKPINDKPLRYCESSINGSCCTPSMEIKLVSHTKQQLEKTTRDSISKLSSILSTRAVKFNEFFGQLLAESKKEFHLMFKRTYGVIYEENAYVFSDLFNELEKYYSRGKVDLAEAMDSFFNTLYQKMFTVLNSQYAFDDKYLGCVSEHMKELKPFGDVPDKLSVQIKRSFVATRTFAQALFTASDVAKKVMSIRPSENCTAALIKMQQCNVCKGYSEKPCANYCISVMKGCLSYYNELDIEWDNFVAAMDKVSERLIGPFNIVVVVEPINIKISEAIMNFQETGTVIANQVFQGCGRPNLGRPKREIIEPKTEYNKTTPPLESSGAYDTLDIDASLENEIIVIDRFRRSADISNDQQYKSSQSIDAAEQQQNDGKGRRRNKKKHSNRNEDDEDEANKEPVLDKLVKDIRQKVKDSKKFWSNLPNHICDNDDIAAPSNTDKPCWNGHTVERYKYSITADQTTNADFHVTQTTSRHVANQLYYLKTAISNLKNAYNGMDVEWSDQDEPYYGSGSGSGEGIDEEEGSGSGLSAFEDTQTNDPIHMETPSVRVHTQNISSTTSGTVYTPSHETTGTDKTSSKASRMSLRQAIITYLFPIYILWFGGIISDLL